MARLKEKWHGEEREWKQRRLEGLEVVYLWADGVYVKAGLEKNKAALLVMIAGLSDGRKVILAVEPGYRESTESWSAVLRDLKNRGLNCPKLVAGDGNLGLWGALRNVYPEAAEQRCWNHKILNVLDRLPKKEQGEGKRHLQQIAYADSQAQAEKEQGEGKRHLQQIAYADSQAQAEKQRDRFVQWCREESYPAAGETLVRDWERMVTFYQFPKEHWKHLRTTNPVESPFAGLGLRTDAAKRYKKVDPP